MCPCRKIRDRREWYRANELRGLADELDRLDPDVDLAVYNANFDKEARTKRAAVKEAAKEG